MKELTEITQLSELENKKIIIYCAGSAGHQVYNLFTKKHQGIEVFAFCDTFKTGQDKISGLDILLPSDLARHKDAIIAICLSDYLRIKDVHDIERKLKNLGFAKQQIIRYSLIIKLFSEFDSEEFDWQKYSDDIYDFNSNILLIEKMAEWIETSDTSVVDLGAGSMNLKRFIAPDVKYYPVDYKRRSPETIVCDFNKDEFPDVFADVYFLCAMLYFIEDPLSLLIKVANHAGKKVIIGLHSEDLSKHKELMHVSGFVSYLYFDEIEDCLSKLGFSLTKDAVHDSVARRYVLFERTGT